MTKVWFNAPRTSKEDRVYVFKNLKNYIMLKFSGKYNRLPFPLF